LHGEHERSAWETDYDFVDFACPHPRFAVHEPQSTLLAQPNDDGEEEGES
jgi:hypothetical protein